MLVRAGENQRDYHGLRAKEAPALCDALDRTLESYDGGQETFEQGQALLRQFAQDSRSEAHRAVARAALAPDSRNSSRHATEIAVRSLAGGLPPGTTAALLHYLGEALANVNSNTVGSEIASPVFKELRSESGPIGEVAQAGLQIDQACAQRQLARVLARPQGPRELHSAPLDTLPELGSSNTQRAALWRPFLKARAAQAEGAEGMALRAVLEIEGDYATQLAAEAVWKVADWSGDPGALLRKVAGGLLKDLNSNSAAGAIARPFLKAIGRLGNESLQAVTSSLAAVEKSDYALARSAAVFFLREQQLDSDPEGALRQSGVDMMAALEGSNSGQAAVARSLLKALASKTQSQAVRDSARALERVDSDYGVTTVAKIFFAEPALDPVGLCRKALAALTGSNSASAAVARSFMKSLAGNEPEARALAARAVAEIESDFAAVKVTQVVLERTDWSEKEDALLAVTEEALEQLNGSSSNQAALLKAFLKPLSSVTSEVRVPLMKALRGVDRDLAMNRATQAAISTRAEDPLELLREVALKSNSQLGNSSDRASLARPILKEMAALAPSSLKETALATASIERDYARATVAQVVLEKKDWPEDPQQALLEVARESWEQLGSSEDRASLARSFLKRMESCTSEDTAVVCKAVRDISRNYALQAAAGIFFERSEWPPRARDALLELAESTAQSLGGSSDRMAADESFLKALKPSLQGTAEASLQQAGLRVSKQREWARSLVLRSAMTSLRTRPDLPVGEAKRLLLEQLSKHTRRFGSSDDLKTIAEAFIGTMLDLGKDETLVEARKQSRTGEWSGIKEMKRLVEEQLVTSAGELEYPELSAPARMALHLHETHQSPEILLGEVLPNLAPENQLEVADFLMKPDGPLGTLVANLPDRGRLLGWEAYAALKLQGTEELLPYLKSLVEVGTADAWTALSPALEPLARTHGETLAAALAIDESRTQARMATLKSALARLDSSDSQVARWARVGLEALEMVSTEEDKQALGRVFAQKFAEAGAFSGEECRAMLTNALHIDEMSRGPAVGVGDVEFLEDEILFGEQSLTLNL